MLNPDIMLAVETWSQQLIIPGFRNDFNFTSLTCTSPSYLPKDCMIRDLLC